MINYRARGDGAAVGDGVFERHSADDGELRLELVAQPEVSYALVFNGVPLVRSITVTDLTSRPVTDVTVSLQLCAAGWAVTEPWTRKIALLAPLAEVTITPVDDLLTDTACLGAAEETRPGLFTAAVARRCDDPRVAARSTRLAGNEWLAAPALLEALRARPAQHARRRRAAPPDRGADADTTRSSSLDGYQGGPERAGVIAAAFWDVLRGQQIHRHPRARSAPTPRCSRARRPAERRTTHPVAALARRAVRP